jgi:hypothetical protein
MNAVRHIAETLRDTGKGNLTYRPVVETKGGRVATRRCAPARSVTIMHGAGRPA